MLSVDYLVLKEQGEIQSSVQEALSLLVDCFNTDTIDAAQLTQLEALVLQSIEQVRLLCNYFDRPHDRSCLSLSLSFPVRGWVTTPIRSKKSQRRQESVLNFPPGQMSHRAWL